MATIDYKSETIKCLQTWVRVHNKHVSSNGKDSFCICWKYDGSDVVLYGRDKDTFYDISHLCAVIEALHLNSYAEIWRTKDGKRLQVRVYE